MTPNQTDQGEADNTFTLLRSIAQSWREWDRTENPRDTEGRILDGAAWGILTAIREGKIPGVALKTYDGTTCWQCEKCGKTRTGRGCMKCLENDLSTSQTEAAHPRAQLAGRDAEWERKFVGHVYVKSDEYSALITERDDLRSQLAAATDAERAVFNATIDEVQAGWRECQAALKHTEELLANQTKETDARRNERDAATAEASNLRNLLREARARIKFEKRYVIDHANNTVSVPDEPCLADRIDAALTHSAVAPVSDNDLAKRVRAFLKYGPPKEGSAGYKRAWDEMNVCLPIRSAVTLEMRGDK